eukprot:3107008-Prorocentrum_lima.AAC.1
MPGRHKVYAVAIGRCTGLFQSWEDAKKQVCPRSLCSAMQCNAMQCKSPRGDIISVLPRSTGFQVAGSADSRRTVPRGTGCRRM